MLSAHDRSFPANVHRVSEARVKEARRNDGRSIPERKTRKSFHSNEVTIEVEENFSDQGDIRFIKRGRGYVKVRILFNEELRWLQDICWREKKKSGDYQQLGSLRGGSRTLICSRLHFGAVRKLELRLFAPNGRRQMCIPELLPGCGWIFFAELLSSFVPRRNEGPRPSPLMEEGTHIGRKSFINPAALQGRKSYLQAVRLPS